MEYCTHLLQIPTLIQLILNESDENMFYVLLLTVNENYLPRNGCRSSELRGGAGDEGVRVMR